LCLRLIWRNYLQLYSFVNMNCFLVFGLALVGLASAQPTADPHPDLSAVTVVFKADLKKLLATDDAGIKMVSANITNLENAIMSLLTMTSTADADLNSAQIAIAQQISYMGTEVVNTASSTGDGSEVWEAFKVLGNYVCDYLQAGAGCTKDSTKKMAILGANIMCDVSSIEQAAAALKQRLIQLFPATAPFSGLYTALGVIVDAANALTGATAATSDNLTRNLRNAFNTVVNMIAFWPPSMVNPEEVEALSVINNHFCIITKIGEQMSAATNIYATMAFQTFGTNC